MGDQNHPTKRVNTRRPIPDPDDSHWKRDAACQGENTEYWFSKDPETVRYAKRICEACPVKLDCLADALDEEDGISRSGRHGIRGGLGGNARLRLQTKLKGMTNV